MAERAGKRRKLEHVSSDEEDDASFASFGESEEEDYEEAGGEIEDEVNGVENEVLDQEDDEEDDDDIDGLEDSGAADVDVESAENDDGVGEDGEPAAASSKMYQEKRNRADGAKARRAATETARGAYAAGMFKSNMFKLQVDELLEQIRPRRSKREEAAEQALHSLKKTLDQSAARAPLSVEDAERQLLMSSKVAIPFPHPRPPKDAKYKLEFARSSRINVVGSYALKMNSRSSDALEIDMTVTMPSSLFQEKDYLNYRYFYKRAYYLACLSASLKKAHPSTHELRYGDFHGDRLKPILVATPSQTLNADDGAKPIPKWRINIIPCVDGEVFPKDKLSPNKNCIRPAGDAKPEPTPFYNSSLRADMLMSSYLKLLHGAATTCEAFRDACLLGNTWLRQRGLGSDISDGGFGNFEWSALIALLLQGGGPNGKPMLGEGYSSYQVFKATLQLLAMRDLSEQILVVGDGDAKPVGEGLPVVWDAARAHNVLYKATAWAYSQLRLEAKTTLSTLGDQLFDGFDATFILRTDGLLMRYDYVMEVPASAAKDGEGSPAAGGPYHKLHDILKRGLGDRVSLINVKPPSPSSWQLGSARPSVSINSFVIVGLLVDGDTVNRTVDHGPPAESKAKAASFRKFWGEKAELRRFKDGSINESLVWNDNEGGKTVLEQILRFLLSRHFSQHTEQRTTFAGHGFPRLLRQGTGMAGFQPLMEAYKQLELNIRGLEGLPLSVRQIMPADAQLRCSSIRPPSESGSRQHPMPANVTIQFEGSARWPDDLVVIQRTKTAFLLKLTELLREANDSVTVGIGLENQDQDILNQAYVDVIYDSGAAFRMRIHHDREQTLLERQLKDKSLAPSAKEAAAHGLAAYRRDYIRAPAHTQAVLRLCSRYPALSGTVRLLKKWFSSHLLANHIADEVVELMAVRTFMQPWPWQTPSSVHTGFLRALHWLARWDWRAEPLIVDLSSSGELKQADVQGIRTRFEAWRKLGPSMNRIVLFAASNVDTDGTTWTDGRPQRVVAGRMTALAKAACAEVEEEQLALEPTSLFTSPLTDYDFVLHLDLGFSGGKRRKGTTDAVAFKNLQLASLNDEAMVGFDAVQLFLEELESLYGSAILFVSGGSEKPVIAGLWSPQTAPRGWKMNLAYSTTPAKARKKAEDDVVQAEVNKDGIIAEIARLGGDLIESVEVNRQ